MSTKAKIGYGVTLGYGATSGTYTSIAEISAFTPPELSAGEIKVQRSDASTPVAEKVSDWQENSDPEVEITYQTSVKTALYALVGLPYFFKATWPLTGAQTVAGDTVSWTGFIKSFGDTVPIKGDYMKSKVKFAVSGATTLAAGS